MSKQITFTLTDKQEEFLKKFASKHYENSKDNLATEHPLHMVQTRRERVIDPEYDYADVVKYCVPDWGGTGYDSAKELIEAFYEDEECPIKIVSFDEAYDMERFIDINGEDQVILDEEDYFEAYGIEKEFYYKVNIEYYYDTVACFFILEEAKKYMEYQGHNLIRPRTYTIGAGYANKGEYHHFWELLFNLGKQLNESKE